MKQQTIKLFIRALIIGLFLQGVIHQFSEAPLSQQGKAASEQIQHLFHNAPASTAIHSNH